MKRTVPGPTGGQGPKDKQQQTRKNAAKASARPRREEKEETYHPQEKKPAKSKRFDPKALSEESKRAAAQKRREQNEREERKRSGRNDNKASRPGQALKVPRRDARRNFNQEEEQQTEKPVPLRSRKQEEKPEALMTLNKYLAHSGISSRRDAAALIKQGKVMVNGTVKLEPGYRVQPGDKVTMEGKKMEPVREMVYLLLNKPKGFITTTEDDKGRRTVMELVDSAGVDRLYPVGRLDRNTTGLLLMTNDGDLAQKLSHPKYQAKKIYQVTLDKPFLKADFEKVLAGVMLEDGLAQVDKLAYLAEKNELGLEIHSGRNRIVRRIFEALNYEVVKLDRVMYAGLTKKNLPRGKWRLLSEKEIIMLKHFKS